MIVESLELMNFRNYEYLNISFDNDINILFGDNAQGKTNILEALFISGTTKSHKGNNDKELIRFSNEEGHIKTKLVKNDINYQIDIHLKKNKKKGIAVNGIPLKRAADIFGLLNVVLFSPEDLNIIKEGPSERRRFLDIIICQIDKIYFYNLTKYNKVLKQRNKLLKDAKYNPELLETLEIWDLQLCEYGNKIISRRSEFIKELNIISKKIHESLTGNEESLRINYLNNVNIDSFANELTKNRERDIKYQNTMTGPHKDDIEFFINDKEVKKYGSQGQQRTTALSLKLSEIEIIKKYNNDNPILLLDDVLSELDKKRQNFLLNSISDIQTIITCTGLDEFINKRFQINKIYKIVDGKVVSLN